MKRAILILLICTYSFAYGQRKQLAWADSIINNKTIRIPYYKMDNIGHESKFFPMPFGRSEFEDTTGMYQLLDADILSVDLVFTDYPSNLDLKALNRNRFLALSKLLPNAANNSYTQWQTFRQMNGYSKETAKGMLHGFVINYRPKASPAFTKAEVNFIKSITPEEVIIEPETPKAELPKKKVNNWNEIHKSSRTKYFFYNERQVKEMGHDKKAISRNIEPKDSLVAISVRDAVENKFITQKDYNTYKGKDSVYLLLYPAPEPDTFLLKRMYRPRPLPVADSTVIKIFKRNTFKSILVVADVTASMSPYTAQFIQWLSEEANQKNLRSLVCFNDGDRRQDKPLGNTEGIYGELYNNPIQISELVQRTMAKGSGGDLPENDCEALIKGIAMFKDYEDVILIADAWAPVRDIGLANQITKPVHVMACGSCAPHPDYVHIAFVTKGTLHIDDADVVDLSPLQFGKPITIRGRSYIVDNGRVAFSYK
jgi:hypothetical protein